MLTEIGLVEQLQAAHPDKTIIPAYNGARCQQMKKNSLEKIVRVLQDLPEENRIKVPEKLVPRIRNALEKMNSVTTSPVLVKAKTES